MADRPIIFSAPMVRALMAGTKTQTRRLCAWANNPNSPQLTYIVACDEPGWFGDEEGEVQFRAFCAPGDRLYVREAWSHTGQGVWDISAARLSGRGGVIYRADGELAGAKYWPSIHMPREFSRLTLTVTDVRVQRLQDCSEADAIAEGIECVDDPRGTAWKSYETCKDGSPHPHASVPNRSPLTSYRELWDSLHTAEGTTWVANPWVVAVTFAVHHGNIDQGTGHG